MWIFVGLRLLDRRGRNEAVNIEDDDRRKVMIVVRKGSRNAAVGTAGDVLGS